ncbi:MAG TPA: glycosyltransferase family 2 protein [Ktedonobacteraceae bacterium]|nr:glycosyltransferase family 2 protein [Ktedonobacteraceae bacterium]
MKNSICDISVIICAYTEDRWTELLKAVESIRQQNIVAREIILVIDHNTSLLERSRMQIADAIVIENNRPKGLSGARNSGIARAKGLFIAFLDDDAIAEPDWLERLNAGCQNPHVLGTGGVVEPLWVEKRPDWFPHEFYWVVGCSYQEKLRTVTEVRNPYGGCTCIRREVFEVIGGFHEKIGRVGNHPLGGEETELSIRATQHWPDKVFLCDPQARIHHHIQPARATWSYFFRRCYAEGISKAAITTLVGAKDSLASERAYTLLTLPKGVARGLAEGIFRQDPAGFLRAGAIVSGLGMTGMGYLAGRLALWASTNKKADICNKHVPMQIATLKKKA